MPDLLAVTRNDMIAEVERKPPLGRQIPSLRDAMPVACDICEWHGRRIKIGKRPCPQCGSRVQWA
jgi:hypothetical protein